MVDLIAAMNQILWFAGEILFKFLWKAEKWSAGAWILQKQYQAYLKTDPRERNS